MSFSRIHQLAQDMKAREAGLHHQSHKPADLVAAAQSVPELSTLVKLVIAAKLVDTLSGPNLTAFVPTNAAFEDFFRRYPGIDQRLTQDTKSLQNLLAYHVRKDAVTASQALNLVKNRPVALSMLSSFKTVVSSIDHSSLFVNQSKVVKADVMCQNGSVAHVIDEILVDPNTAVLLSQL